MIGVKKLIVAASLALAAVTFSITAQPAEARDHHRGHHGHRGYSGQRYYSYPRSYRSYPRYYACPQPYYRPSPYYYPYPYNPAPCQPSLGSGFGFGFQYWDD